MRLSTLELNFQYKMPNGERTAILQREHFVELSFDPVGQTVLVETAFGRERFPVAGNVRRMVELVGTEPCPECAHLKIPATFQDARALAAHRAARHNVKGTSRKGPS